MRPPQGAAAKTAGWRGARAALAGVVALGMGWPIGALAAIEPERGLSLPRDVSVDGHRIDHLLWVTNAGITFLFVVMCAWMLLACFRHGRKHTAVYDTGGSWRSVVITLSLTAFVFALVDGTLTVNTLIDLREAFWNFEKPEKDPRTVRIQINAHQWAWDARYAGTDGRFGTEDDIVTWNELPVKAGAPVYLQLTSTDVVHSFWVPNFRVKQDAVPGRVTKLWFQPREEVAGDYAIGCTQHCGPNHYKMAGVLRVLSPETFAAWEAEASALAKRGYDAEDAAAQWGWEWSR